jgi:UDP-N-acetyl-D-galactosamine dehydrogenase
MPNLGINLLDKIDKNYELIVLAVSHENFISLDFKKLKKQNSIIFDLKSVLDKSIVDSRL